MKSIVYHKNCSVCHSDFETKYFDDKKCGICATNSAIHQKQLNEMFRCGNDKNRKKQTI